MSLEPVETEACGALNLLTLPGQAQLVPEVTRQRSGEDSEIGAESRSPRNCLTHIMPTVTPCPSTSR